MNDTERRSYFLSTLVIGLTLLFCVFFYYEHKLNAYEVLVGSIPVGCIKDPVILQDTQIEVCKEIEERFGSSQIKDELYLKKVKTEENTLYDIPRLKKALLNHLKMEVQGVEMFSNGRLIGTLASKEEIIKVLDYVRDYYINKHQLDKKDITQINLKNNITYEEKAVPVASIREIKEVAEAILRQDESTKEEEPLICFQITAQKQTTEAIQPSTVVTLSQELPSGQTRVKTEGQKGTALVKKEFSYTNNSKRNEKIISRVVQKAPKDKVIFKGIKNSVATGSILTSPLSRGQVTSVFGERWGKMHKGIDIAAPSGTPIYAVLDGIVSFVGIEEGYGKVIKIQHKGGMETTYGHCSMISVSKNQKVKKGQKIGAVGSTGRSTGPHVHFEIRVNGEPINPSKYLR